MDKLHSVMRNLQGERKSEPAKPAAHLTVFRDFVAHLDRMSRAAERTPRAKSPRVIRRKGKR